MVRPALDSSLCVEHPGVELFHVSRKALRVADRRATEARPHVPPKVRETIRGIRQLDGQLNVVVDILVYELTQGTGLEDRGAGSRSPAISVKSDNRDPLHSRDSPSPGK
jgi:hypothetical protein